MQVPDHAGCLQQGVSHLLIAAPSTFYGECNGVEINETVTAWSGWNTDCFAHVADCCDGPFKHTPLLIVVEVIEPVASRMSSAMKLLVGVMGRGCRVG